MNLRAWKGFCSKVSSVKFGKESSILSVKELTYKPKQPLVFRNGRCTIFESKETPFLEIQLQQLGITVPFWMLGYAIFNNPFYLSFPASLPIMFLAQVFILRRYFLRRRDFLFKLGRIDLLRNGESVELIYQHDFNRGIRGMPLRETRYIPDLFMVERRQSDPPDPLHQYPQFPGWGYTFKFFINRNFFWTLPSKHVANREVLDQVMQGIMIDTSLALDEQ